MHTYQTQETSDSEPTSESLLILLAPLLGLGVVTALLALGTGLSGWYTTEMLIAAAIIGSATAFLSIYLLYRQRQEREASQRALQDVEARVHDMVESAMDPIVTIDENQCIVRFNTAAEQVFGWPRSAVLGQPLQMLIPERFRHAHGNHVRKYSTTGNTSRRMGLQSVLMGLRANQEEFPVEASISQHGQDGKKLFTAILRDVTERVRAEAALRRSREELRELAKLSQSVREQEKSRIARELHDELAQSLTALKMDTAWLIERLPEQQTALGEKLKAMQTLLDNTVTATRRISSDLRPLMLDDLGLIPAAEWLVQNFSQRTGVVCELTADDDMEIEDPHATAAFRILQEALTNIAKHAHASHVDVSIEQDDGTITLTVSDNGSGFSLQDPRKPDSFGLMGLRERAYLLDGDVDITSNPGQGTRICVRIPLLGSSEGSRE